MSIYSSSLVKRLASLGIVANKTGKETTPNLPPPLLKHYYRGYFDGDGSIYKTGNRWTVAVSCASEDFLCGIREVFSGVSSTNGHMENKGNCYQLTYNGNLSAPKIAHYLYENAKVYLSRKYEAYMKLKDLL